MQFLESTRLAFSLSHSVFIEHLQKKGLTDREVSYCCLYCIGLNGSEISNYLDIKSFYNISKVIRKKLSIDRSINIDTYLRKILENKCYEFNVNDILVQIQNADNEWFKLCVGVKD